MKEWLLQVVGVVFLGVLIDILYPSGKTSAFCKGIYGVVAMVALLYPLFNLNLKNINNSNLIDEKLLDDINNAKIDATIMSTVSQLQLRGIDGVDVELSTKIEDNEIIIENVYVDTTNIVLTENLTNINKYEVVSKEVSEIFDISIEKVIVYG